MHGPGSRTEASVRSINSIERFEQVMALSYLFLQPIPTSDRARRNYNIFHLAEWCGDFTFNAITLHNA